MQNNMQIWLESSTTTFNLNSHDEGVYLVSDLDGLTSLPEIRTSQGVNAGTDGGWTSAQAFDARLISLNIVIANEDESIVESKRRTLNSLLAQSRKESLKLHFISEAGMEYVISVRVTNVSGALSNILKKQNLLIQMRADDPIIYGAQGGEGVDATLTVQQAQGGFEIPFDIPLIIDGGTDKVNVENLGSEEVYPVIKMTGPLHNPTVVNETQNAEIGVNADLGDMEWRGYKSAEIYGNTTQTTLSGKNLFNKGATPYALGSGVSVSELDTGVRVSYSGSETTGARFATYIVGDLSSYVGKNIVLSTTMSVSGTNAPQISFGFCKSDGSDKQTKIMLSQSGSSSFGITSEIVASRPYGYLYIYANGPNGTTVQSGDYADYSNVQVEISTGSTATDYEQYCGGVPSPNPAFPSPVNVVSGEQTVKITGKNLLDSHYATAKALNTTGARTWDDNAKTCVFNGITFTFNDDGTISASGTSSGASYLLLGNPLSGILASGTDYIINGSPDGASSGAPAIRLYTGSSYQTITDQTQFTFDSQSYVRINVPGSLTISNVVFKPMIRPASITGSTYEPYQGQSYEINLGGNLFDRANATENQIIIWTNGALTAENKSIVGDYISASEGQRFSSNYKACVLFYNSSKTYLGSLQTDGTTVAKSGGGQFSSFTIPSGNSVAYIRVEFRSNANSNIDMTQQDIMLNYGSTALPYFPYTTYQYELCKIGTHQDYIYKSGDKWYKHAEVGKTSVSLVGIYDVAGGLKGSACSVSNKTQTMSGSFCNKATIHTTGAFWDGCYHENPANFLFVGSSTDDLDALKAKYNGAKLYYVLATPTDTEITDSELVGQLEALLDYAPWYGDDQNVFLIPSAGADGTLILGPHNEPKPADVVLIDTQLKTVTLNGQNAYPLLKDGSSFFTLAPGDNTMYLTSDVSSDTGKAEIKFKQGFISI